MNHTMSDLLNRNRQRAPVFQDWDTNRGRRKSQVVSALYRLATIRLSPTTTSLGPLGHGLHRLLQGADQLVHGCRASTGNGDRYTAAPLSPSCHRAPPRREARRPLHPGPVHDARQRRPGSGPEAPPYSATTSRSAPAPS